MAMSTRRASDRRWEYQVFLSFRGEDTRTGFVSHLYHELQDVRGIRTFKDDQDLERGTTISPELLSAIEQSHFSIIVLSPKYASSSWCLNELTKIIEVMEARKTILPVFYQVEPSTVRYQTGSFVEAFAKHEEQFISTEGREKVKHWKANLTKVANLSGWDLKNYKSDRELIEEIAKSVRMKVQPTFKLLDSSHKLVGINSALNQLSALLALDEDDVRFIGITGMGGIGKTTLANIVFDSISHDQFDVVCFLANVREVSAKEGSLVGLQKQLVSRILKERVEDVWDERDGIISTKNCLRNRKVLLVLDDVDHLNQLQKLAGNKDWFGKGSRIILTTRNERLLLEHGITLSHKVEVLSAGDALQLFSLKAFEKDQPPEDFSKLCEDFVKYAGGVPLVLETLGSSLRQRNRVAWDGTWVNLQKSPNSTVFDKLKVSYDGLEEEMHRRIFLDIACFHKGKDKEEVIDILDRRFGDISSFIVIDILIERSLLTMLRRLEMHDLIQEMAWEIVRRESKEEPGERTRIWHLDDLRHVLTANTGTPKLEAIVIYSPRLEEVRCNSEAFSIMCGLRLLKLNNVIITFSGRIFLPHSLRIILRLIKLNNLMIPFSRPIFLPHSLRIIDWCSYSSKFLPQRFPSHSLIELNLRYSKLVQLWDGRKDFPNLKYMDLCGSDMLTYSPDFTGTPNLEELRFTRCKNLVHIHPSMAVLKRLQVLSLSNCESIKSLPSELEMDSLETLNLWCCSELEKFPEFLEGMKTLSELHIGGAATELPSSIENLVGLTKLNVSFCELVKLWDGRKVRLLNVYIFQN